MNRNLVGVTLDKYRCEEFIGLGGMAEVYRGTDTELDRPVALKVLHPFLVTEEGFVERFRREARALAALKHPNIVQIYDSGLLDFNSYLVMEYVSGQTLKDRLQALKANGEHLPLAEVRHIFDALISALRYAHSQNIIHRDLKPSNVLLSEDGRVVLTDFGLAKIMGSSIHTASMSMMGTPAYMAPEQALSGKIKPYSDVYSLGVMLFEMLAGNLPFQADTPLAMIDKHRQETMPRLSKMRRDVPGSMDRVLRKAMAKNPEDRFQNVDQFAEALSAAFEGKRRIPFVSLRPDWVRAPSGRVALAAIGILILGLGGAGGLFSASPLVATPTLQPTATATPDLLRALIIGQVNLYEEPDASSNIVAQLEPGMEVVLLDRSGPWWQVRVIRDDLIGWVMVSDLDFIPTPTPLPTLTNTPPPGASLTPTPTASVTSTPLPFTPTASATASATVTPTSTSDGGSGGSPTSTSPPSSGTPSPTPTSSSPTLTPTSTPTTRPSPSNTNTAVPTVSATPLPTASATPDESATHTPTATPGTPTPIGETDVTVHPTIPRPSSGNSAAQVP